MVLSARSYNSLQNEYKVLKSLIAYRQAIEAANPQIEAYKSHPTTYDFVNIHEHNLLYLAAILSDFETVRRLVEEYHVSVNPSLPESPLAATMYEGHVQIATYLLGQGAHILTVKRKYLNYALQNLFDQEVRSILERAKQEHDYPTGKLKNSNQTAFELMIELGEVDAIVLELDKCSRKEDFREFIEAHTPLHYALEEKQENIVKVLVKRYPELCHISDKEGNLPLHFAALWNPEIMAELKTDQTDVNARNCRQETALFWAVQAQNQACVDFLLQHNARTDISNYLGFTLYHENVRSGNRVILPDTPAKNKKNCFGLMPEDYILESINLSQDNIIPRFKYYLMLKRRTLDYFDPRGYCNGLTFVHNFNDSRGKKDQFFAIITAWATWDGSLEPLFEPPPEILQEDFRTLGEAFEVFLSLTIFHQTSELKAEIQVPINDRDKQLKLLGHRINYILPPLSMGVTPEQLSELLTFFSRIPGNHYLEISTDKHIISVKCLGNGTFSDYYDSNFKQVCNKEFDNASLTQFIIETLCKREAFPINLEFSVYSLPKLTETVNTVNIFTPDQLPKNLEEVKKMYKSSENGFDPMTIAILTASWDNVRYLMERRFYDLDYKNKHGKTVAYYLERSANPQILEYLYWKEVAEKPRSPIANKLLYQMHEAVLNNEPDVLHKLLNQNPQLLFETNVFALDTLREDTASNEIKMVLVANFHNFIDEEQGPFIMQAIRYGRINALHYILEFKPTYLNRPYKDQTPLEAFCETSCINQLIAEGFEANKLGIIAVFKHLKQKISYSNGFGLLRLIHAFGEPLLSEYAAKLCQMITPTRKGPRIYKFNLLQHFSQLKAYALCRIILGGIKEDINYQNCANATALHYVLRSEPAEEEKENFEHLVQEFAEKGARIDIPDQYGTTCEMLLKEHYPELLKRFFPEYEEIEGDAFSQQTKKARYN